MEKNKVVEDAIKRLQELDRQIDDGDDDSESLLLELNAIMNGIAKGDQINPPKSTLKFVNLSTNPDPEYGHEGSSGFDIRAYIMNNGEIHIPPGGIRVISTGLYFEVEKGLEIQIRSIKTLSSNKIMILKSPGTIDFRDKSEIKIIMVNLGDERFGDQTFVIKNGDKIAQGVVCPIYGEENLTLTKVDKLSDDIS